MSKSKRRAATVFLGIGLTFFWAVSAPAAGPTIEKGHVEEETFFDDLIFDLCGIETMTTLTQRFTVKDFPDGSHTLQVVRTFVPDDPRIPVEKGAATSFIDPDGTVTVKGKPIQLISRDGGGVTLLDAGLVTFGEELLIHGPHPSLFVDDLAPYYCPPEG